MRRSAAPSVRANIKRARFLPHVIQNIPCSEKENECFSEPVVQSHSTTKDSSHSASETKLDQIADKSERDGVKIRSNEDVLDLILEDDISTTENSQTINNISTNGESNSDDLSKNSNLSTNFNSPNTNDISTNVENNSDDSSKRNKLSTNLKPVKKNFLAVSTPNKTLQECSMTLSNCIYCTKNMEEVSLFNVVWCKRSGKKHKTWEGDGILIVKTRSAVLKDFSGKTLDKGVGYKLKETESLEEGSSFFIGGKECEIQCKIPEEEYQSGKYCKCSSSSETPMKKEESPIKVKKPLKSFYPPMPVKMKPGGTNGALLEQNISEENFILPSPTEDCEKVHNEKGLPIAEVCVDSFLTKKLRSHQKDGIIFMYKCIMGFQHNYGQGVILADEMGLGKTLQCIALIWTLYKRGPYGGSPILRRVIIITPSSLVSNWHNEFHKWLGKNRLSIFAVNQKNTVKDFVKLPKAVLIISYEMFLRSSKLLSSMHFDLLICDEGHRIKNLNIKLSNVINCISTSRRILLTGTPIQNDLAEFFSIVDFVNPGALGTLQFFRKYFEKPISQSRNQECTEWEKEHGEEVSKELGKMTKLFMLRRTQGVIKQYLPPKNEAVIFCRPSDLQRSLYNHFLKSRAVEDIFSSSTSIDSATPLVCISVLRKLCNHPSLLLESQLNEESSSNNSVMDHMETDFPAGYKLKFTDSGKMKVLESMLSSMLTQNKMKEKVVIVSGFTKTLDILELLCKQKRYEFLRLDGSTNTTSRQDIVDVFNRSYTKFNVFLLSSKAGGVGLNLTGASRIILYDIDWNPANDLQAMSRIWRDGQLHKVYVYRLLTTGTIEEKMYQRQLSKQCLSGSVLESNSSGKMRFSKEELKDIFTFYEETRCITHDLINCKCLSLEHILNMGEFECLENSDSTDEIKNIGMAQLMNWTHICGPISKENCSDSCLVNGGSDITFIFQNIVNARQKP